MVRTCRAECTKYVHETEGFLQNKDRNIWRYTKYTNRKLVEWYQDDKTRPESIWRPEMGLLLWLNTRVQTNFWDLLCAALLQGFLRLQSISKDNQKKVKYTYHLQLFDPLFMTFIVNPLYLNPDRKGKLRFE